jgi:ER membrane protein complex subunit 3
VRGSILTLQPLNYSLTYLEAISSEFLLESMSILQHTQQNILLDSQIRDWVVIPLFVIMICAGLLRFHVGNLLKPAPKNASVIQQRTQGLLKFTSSLKTGSTHFLSTSRIQARFTAYPELLRDQAEWILDYAEAKEKEEKDNSAAGADVDMPNPLAAMDGMKGQMAFMVQNMLVRKCVDDVCPMD